MSFLNMKSDAIMQPMTAYASTMFPCKSDTLCLRSEYKVLYRVMMREGEVRSGVWLDED